MNYSALMFCLYDKWFEVLTFLWDVKEGPIAMLVHAKAYGKNERKF